MHVQIRTLHVRVCRGSGTVAKVVDMGLGISCAAISVWAIFVGAGHLAVVPAVGACFLLRRKGSEQRKLYVSLYGGMNTCACICV
jgi:hypothetical protein